MKGFVYFITLVLFLFTKYIYATHLTGAELSWDYLGNDSFLLKAQVYRDCNGVKLDNVQLVAQNKYDDSLVLNIFQGKKKDITPLCSGQTSRCSKSNSSINYGFEYYTFSKIVSFSSLQKSGNCVINISFRNCCRSNNIVGKTYGLYVEATINTCQAAQPYSLKWAEPSDILICTQQNTLINNGISINGANSYSVKYRFDTVKTAKNTYYKYPSGYQYNKPIYYGGFPKTDVAWPNGFIIDENTGLLKFSAQKIEMAFVKVHATIYHDKSIIGTMERDVQYISIKCPNFELPYLSGMNCRNNNSDNLETAIFPENKLCFTVCSATNSTDDTVKIGMVNPSLEDATFGVLNPGDRHETGRFCWAPKAEDARLKAYSVKIYAQSMSCGYKQYVEQEYLIKVKQKADFNYQFEDLGCGKLKISFSKTNETSVSGWIIKVGNHVKSLDSNDNSVIFSELDNKILDISISAIAKNGYNVVKTDTFSLMNGAPFNLKNYEVLKCVNRDSEIDMTDFLHENSTFQWNDNNSTEIVRKIRENTDYKLMAIGSNGICTDTLFFKVKNLRLKQPFTPTVFYGDAPFTTVFTLSGPSDADNFELNTDDGKQVSLSKGAFPYTYLYKKVGDYKPFLIGKSNKKTCTDTEFVASSIHVFPTGIESKKFTSELSIYPNPANDLLFIESNIERINTIRIFGMDGRLVKTLKPNENNASINVSELKAGMFMLEIISNNKIIQELIVIQ